jgi:hypothetical protein
MENSVKYENQWQVWQNTRDSAKMAAYALPLVEKLAATLPLARRFAARLALQVLPCNHDDF